MSQGVFEDLTGQRFGNLVVLKREKTDRGDTGEIMFASLMAVKHTHFLNGQKFVAFQNRPFTTGTKEIAQLRLFWALANMN